MNLDKLFQAQKELRERINYNGEDRFDKIVLALLVEIGECANEQRSWKFWSKRQEPRIKIICPECEGTGERHVQVFSGTYHVDDDVYTCPCCKGKGHMQKNPLLEEYVDGLHFVLEAGIEKGWETDLMNGNIEIFKNDNITTQFIQVKRDVLDMWSSENYVYYKILFGSFIGLGQLLGFTWDEIEAGYFAKNQINHSRQENGY